MFVKICGVTNEDDALLAVAMGADAVGFIFAPSPRQVHPEVARDIARRLPHEVVTVGVFKDELPERVVEVVNRVGLRGAQVHGGESAEDISFIRSRVGFVIRALPAGDPRLSESSRADIILLDSAKPGSGEVFDWSLAEGAPDGIRLMLAGGLTPDNVEQAIRQVRPWGVDVASGVESAPGRKDAAQVRRFVEIAKRVGESLDDDKPTPGSEAPFDWADDDKVEDE